MSFKLNYEPPKMGKDGILEVERAILALSDGETVTAEGQEYVDLSSKYNGNYWE